MKFARRLAGTIAISFVLSSCAGPMMRRPASQGPDPVAEKAVLAEAKKLVREFPRDILSFHWSAASNFGIAPGQRVDPDDPRVKSYIDYKISQFWLHPEIKGGEIGNGLYTAMDPGTSFGGFGGDHKAVVGILVHKGTRFLDLRNEQIPLSPNTRALMARAGCGVSTVAGVFLDNGGTCYQFIVPLVRDLGVNYVAQKWAYTWTRACGGQKPSIAFMIVDMDLKDRRDDYRIFTENSDPEGDDGDEVKNINQAILNWNMWHDSWPVYNKKSVFPDEKATKFIWGESAELNSPEDYDKWVRKHLLSCGDDSEDTPPGEPETRPDVTDDQRTASDLFDRYVEDLKRISVVNANAHTQISLTDIRSVASGQFENENIPNGVFHPTGGQFWRIDYNLLHSWNPGLSYSPALQQYFQDVNPKIADLQNRGTWAWDGCVSVTQNCEFTNPVQLAVAAGQQFLKLQPRPEGAELLAREIMVYIWKCLNQPAVLTPGLFDDLTKLNVADYTSLGGKKNWLGPYIEGIQRIEDCLPKYEKNVGKAARDGKCGQD